MSESLLEKFYKSNEEKERVKLIDSMLEEYSFYLDLVLNNIIGKKELRNNAYLLNLMSKKKRVNEYLLTKFKRNHFEILINDTDPKTRKNTYIFMGNFINKDYLIDLIKLLKKEDINYCISSLILTLGNYNIKNVEEVMNKYKEILDNKLNNKEIEEVHYKEIVNSINKVIGKSSKVEMHTFTKLNKEVSLYLTCMTPLVNTTLTDVKKYFSDVRKYKDGVIVKTNNLDKVFKIRTFYEALIINNNYSELTLSEVKENINEFLNSNFLFDIHKEKHAFTYRIEFVTTKNKQEKVDVYNTINEMINKSYKDKYQNNPSSYEFEIRIIDNGENYDVFYKLYTYKDNRYDYRIKDLPASINPTSASIMLNEVSKYLRKGARVLDPFCGTSTMLIERSYINECDLTGVDISASAIEYSRVNSKACNVSVNLVKQNCLEHEGYYDEIISNMPYGNRVGTHLSNEILYKDFINRLVKLLNDNGVAILLTSEISLIKKLVKNKSKLQLIKDIYCETGGLTPHLFVIKKV